MSGVARNLESLSKTIHKEKTVKLTRAEEKGFQTPKDNLKKNKGILGRRRGYTGTGLEFLFIFCQRPNLL